MKKTLESFYLVAMLFFCNYCYGLEYADCGETYRLSASAIDKDCDYTDPKYPAGKQVTDPISTYIWSDDTEETGN
jgi:hypothetical protein